MIKSIIAPPIPTTNNNKKNITEEDKEDAKQQHQHNSQIYSSTNRILICLIIQLISIIAASFPVISGVNQFFNYTYIFDGLSIELWPCGLIAVMLAFALLASIWQFASILSFRSFPLALNLSKNGFLPAILIGCLLSFMFISTSIALLSTSSNGKESIEKNFMILLNNASMDDDVAKELNILQLRFQCCGSIPTKPLIPSKYQKYYSLEPFLTDYVPDYLNQAAVKQLNLPFSCCNQNPSSPFCFHQGLNSTVFEESNILDTFPPASNDIKRENIIDSLIIDFPCPKAIFKAIQWQLFYLSAISFMIVGLICLFVTIMGGWSLWKLKKNHQQTNEDPSAAAATVVEMKEENIEVPKVENPLPPSTWPPPPITTQMNNENPPPTIVVTN